MQEWILILIAIILFLSVLAWDVITDYRKWLKHRSVNHGGEWLVRCVLLIPAILFFNFPFSDSNLLKILSSVAMCAFWYWFLFDGIYNKVRGFDWWFTGSDDKDDAKTDDFLQRLSLAEHIVLKFSLIFVFTTLYVIS